MFCQARLGLGTLSHDGLGIARNSMLFNNGVHIADSMESYIIIDPPLAQNAFPCSSLLTLAPLSPALCARSARGPDHRPI